MFVHSYAIFLLSKLATPQLSLYSFIIKKGMDRMIRLYNPYMPARPIAHLRKHTTPIFFIHLSTEDDRIFTMSTDKCLNVT